MEEQLDHRIEWREDPETGELAPFAIPTRGGAPRRAVWAPLPGSQEIFLKCPVFETLYEGNRGLGKTDALIFDFGQYVGRGFGRDWNGLLFRRTYPELDDVINNKVLKWVPKIWPQAKFNKNNHILEWPSGEYIRFRHADDPKDYWKYHGSGVPWIGWEELCTWSDDSLYRRMMSVCRSTNPQVPRRYRATANPYGPGHNWVKARFQLSGVPEYVLSPLISGARDDEGNTEPDRCSIHGSLHENFVLLRNDPGYVDRLRASASNPAELRAWMFGDWDIVAGGMIDDLWRDSVIMVPDFPHRAVPANWKIYRAFDWGSSRPFSVGWWCLSNGEPIRVANREIGSVRGDLIRLDEWYGWNGRPNEGLYKTNAEIALGIVEREKRWGIRGRVRGGPADNQIFGENSGGSGISIAGDMGRYGVRWEPADKGPNSRKQGWQQLRRRMWAGLQNPREEAAIYACWRNEQFRRTMRGLSRSEKDPDDVDTPEDHIGDETRYMLRYQPRVARQGRF